MESHLSGVSELHDVGKHSVIYNNFPNSPQLLNTLQALLVSFRERTFSVLMSIFRILIHAVFDLSLLLCLVFFSLCLFLLSENWFTIFALDVLVGFHKSCANVPFFVSYILVNYFHEIFFDIVHHRPSPKPWAKPPPRFVFRSIPTVLFT